MGPSRGNDHLEGNQEQAERRIVKGAQNASFFWKQSSAPLPIWQTVKRRQGHLAPCS